MQNPRHRQLIVFVVTAMLIFVVLYHVWFWIMGGLAIVGVVFLLKQFSEK